MILKNNLKILKKLLTSISFGTCGIVLTKWKRNHDTVSIQDGNIRKTHFQNLYEDIHISNLEQYIIKEKLKLLSKKKKENQNPLDFTIASYPNRQILQQRKASGPDSICNEKLKYST